MLIKAYNTIPEFQDHDFEATGYVKAPDPTLNGGHYTGEPFETGAEYGDYPVKADAYFMNQQLKTPNAKHQVVDSHRVGNNFQILDSNLKEVNGIVCHEPERAPSTICASNSFADDYEIWEEK